MTVSFSLLLCLLNWTFNQKCHKQLFFTNQTTYRLVTSRTTVHFREIIYIIDLAENHFVEEQTVPGGIVGSPADCWQFSAWNVSWDYTDLFEAEELDIPGPNLDKINIYCSWDVPWDLHSSRFCKADLKRCSQNGTCSARRRIAYGRVCRIA